MNPDATSTPRAAVFEWARAAILCVLLAWTTLRLGGVLAGTRAVTAVIMAALIAVHVADPARGGRARLPGLLFVPFLAFAAANVAWVTPVPWLGWTDWLNWALAWAVFWVVLNGVESPGPRRLVCGAVVVIAAASASVAVYQHFANPHFLMLGRVQAEQYIGRSSGSFGVPNSLGVLMALLIPPVGFLALGKGGRGPVFRLACVVALLVLFCGFVLAVSRAAWLALAGALVLRALFSPGRSLGRRVAGALAALGLMAAVAVTLYYAFPLMHARANQLVTDMGERTRPILWRGAWKIFEGHPVAGAGAASFDPLFERFRPVGYNDQPYYAHCDYLNTLADYGAVGFLLLAGAAGAVLWRMAGRRGLLGAAFTGLLAFALHLLVDFHMKIPALATTVAVVAALGAAETWPMRPHPASGGLRFLMAGAGAAAALFLIVWATPRYQAEELRWAARDRIDHIAINGGDVSGKGAEIAQVRADLEKAVAIDPMNAQAWSDKAYADSLEALIDRPRTVELGAEAERDADRAIAICPVIAEFWIRKGTGLDMQHKWIDGGDCLVHALNLAPGRADAWYYQAYHLSLRPSETGPALAAANLCLRLDPGFLLAQSLRQRLEDRH